MKWDLDRNLFVQTGLDSGALTMLGSVVHTFKEPGEYRGSVHRPDGAQAVFYLSVDKESPAASTTIDLACLSGYTASRLSAAATPPVPGAEGSQESAGKCGEGERGNRFSVNPKGYVLFHVSQGSGGYSVHVRRAREDQAKDERVFNSQQLGEGDFFAASMIRPGSYRVLNAITKTEGEVVVAYPEMGRTAYRPPAAARVEVGRDGVNPRRVELKPLQGLIFEIKAPARIVISLTRPDDGSADRRITRPRGWSRRPGVV